ncbi:MAG TPA: hypothetical protein VH661_10235 [Candidatus Dormibacteraeota bacterium]|nr:hypothetical protein [Candidatus Dormibacteraeota bacterium]
MLAALVALAGCTSATSLTTPPAVTPTARASATPTPTAAPTPQPLPPLAIIQVGTALVAADAGGAVQWNLTQADMDTLLSAAAQTQVTARVAGPTVTLSTVTPGSGGGRVVVIDGTGTSIGAGSFTRGFEAPFASPTGREWAWSVDDTPSSASPSARHHGRILVAGIATAEHSIYGWVAPSGFRETVANWTDAGIVMERSAVGGCGVGYHNDNASFLLDPVTGTLKDLFSGGDHYGDVRHHVTAGFARSSSTVLVNGTTYDEHGTVANAVYVSPDGARVGVQRYFLGGCVGGPATQRLGTELIEVSSGAHTDIAGCGITGWFDAARFVCTALGDQTQHLETLTGAPGAILGNGTFLGALTNA